MKLSILLPVRPEGLELKVMLRLLRAFVAADHELIVIREPQDEETARIVATVQPEYAELRLVENDQGHGVHAALRAGLVAARGDHVLIYAADEVGPLLAIDDMLALAAEGCDLVSCTRYAHGGRRLGGSRLGGALSWAANRIFHRLVPNSLSDATTGIKLFRRSLFAELDLVSQPVGWLVTFELAIKAHLRPGLVLGEVPIISIDRLFGGDETFDIGTCFDPYVDWFLWGLWRARRVERPPVRVRVPRWKGAEA